MIALIKSLILAMRDGFSNRRNEAAKEPIQRTIEKWDRVEGRLDAMIIDKAGHDFLERALLNREGVPR